MPGSGSEYSHERKSSRSKIIRSLDTVLMLGRRVRDALGGAYTIRAAEMTADSRVSVYPHFVIG